MSGKSKTIPSKKTHVDEKQNDHPKANSHDIGSPKTPKEFALSFPLLKIVDKAQTLPKYSAVLSRPPVEGVRMGDLDALQHDLEALLSASVARTKVLREEMRILGHENEQQDETKQIEQKAGRGIPKRTKKQDTVTKKFKKARKSGVKSPAVKPPSKFTKVKKVTRVPKRLTQKPSTSKVHQTETEGSEVLAPINDTPDKFWASVEPYFVDITEEDIALLHKLIAEQETTECEIPALGRHYTARWVEEDGDAVGTTSGPLTQRLVSALMEDNTAPDERFDRAGVENTEPVHANARLPAVLANARPPAVLANARPPAVLANARPPAVNANAQPPAVLANARPPAVHANAESPMVLRSFSMKFEQQLRKELENLGLIDDPATADTNGVKEEDDEILSDIHRCKSDLQVVSSFNLVQLRRVLQGAERELHRQELSRRLQEVDADICRLHRQIQTNKKNQMPPVKLDQELAWKALKDREALIREIDSK